MHTQGQRKSEDPETSDCVLVQRALNWDQEAFEVLVSRYKQSLFWADLPLCCEHLETEDVLQQVWLKLYLSLATLRAHMRIKPWLFMVARNRSLDVLRHKRLLSFSEVKARNEEDEVAFFDSIPDTSPTPEELAERHDLQREIRRAIQSLPHTYRSVVWLSYGRQLNYAEIGRILKVPCSTVKTQFHRAKPLLRAVFIAQKDVVMVW